MSEPIGPEDRVIVVTFHPNGDVQVQGTPGTTQADFVVAGFLVTRYANRLADDALAAAQPRLSLVTPNREIVVPS